MVPHPLHISTGYHHTHEPTHSCLGFCNRDVCHLPQASTSDLPHTAAPQTGYALKASLFSALIGYSCCAQWEPFWREMQARLFLGHLLLGVKVPEPWISSTVVIVQLCQWLLARLEKSCLSFCLFISRVCFMCLIFYFSSSDPSVMDRLIALEKLMMSCQQKNRLGMLKDVAQSRKEIQVMTHPDTTADIFLARCLNTWLNLCTLCLCEKNHVLMLLDLFTDRSVFLMDIW